MKRQDGQRIGSRRPLVSVCMPVCNHASFVGDAIDSVSGQTLDDIELIVFDDSSSDASFEIARSYADSRIRVYQNPRHRGVARTRNACVKAARGRFVAWLDADDVYEPNALEILVGALLDHPNASMVHAGFQLIDEGGRTVPRWEPPFLHDTVEPRLAAFSQLAVHNYVTTSAVMVRRDALLRAGDFEPGIGPSSTDWNMWLRLALQGDIVYRARDVVSYRRHDGTITNRTARHDLRLRCDIRALDDVFGRCLPDKVMGEIRDRAKAAQAFRWLVRSGEHLRDCRSRRAFLAACRARALSGLATEMHDAWSCLAESIHESNEYEHYQATKTLMARLYEELRATRYGSDIEKIAYIDPDWRETMRLVAARIRLVTCTGDEVAVVDKHDPTALHLSRRRGRHFPEVSGLDKGAYPSTTRQAVESVEALRGEGIDFFVLPSYAFWWLEYYDGFGGYLAGRFRRVWSDEHAIIFDLRVHPGTSEGGRGATSDAIA